jgi:triosephosphate isomerase
MHATLESIEAFAAGLRVQLGGTRPDQAAELLIFPPSCYLAACQRAFQALVAIGAQNIHAQAQGPFTGELAAEMLADLKVGWTLVGHSERRSLFGETNADTAAKVAAALRVGVAPILCVGETLEERRADVAAEVVLSQLTCVIDALGTDWLESGMLAYEPVWAIGTGETATPAQAQQMHALIRAALCVHHPARAEQVRILYGGSVNGNNAAELFSQPDIDGGLVGGASLKVEKFLAIVEAVG